MKLDELKAGNILRDHLAALGHGARVGIQAYKDAAAFAAMDRSASIIMEYGYNPAAPLAAQAAKAAMLADGCKVIRKEGREFLGLVFACCVLWAALLAQHGN